MLRLHRMRAQLVKVRTMQAHQVRGLCTSLVWWYPRAGESCWRRPFRCWWTLSAAQCPIWYEGSC